LRDLTVALPNLPLLLWRLARRKRLKKKEKNKRANALPVVDNISHSGHDTNSPQAHPLVSIDGGNQRKSQKRSAVDSKKA